MKILKGILITILILIIIVVAVVFGFFKFIEYRNIHYYNYAVTGGEIEKKYSVLGSYDVSYIEFDANNEIYKKFEVWYPTEMEISTNNYPLVVIANGTGVKASQYKEVFKHLASWGFIVIGNEDNHSRTGISSALSIDFILSLNKDENSIFCNKIDTDNIGISGHSQGGVGAINAVTNQDNGTYYKAIYTASTTSPFWGQETTLGIDWAYDTRKLNIPSFMIAGTGTVDAGTAIDITATDGQGITPLWAMEQAYEAIPDTVPKFMARQVGKDHGDTLRSANGYMVAWFMWQLKGDEYASEAFLGEKAEILINELYQDAKIDY